MYRNNNKVFAPFQFKKQDAAPELFSEPEGVAEHQPAHGRVPWYLIIATALLIAAAALVLLILL